MERLVVIGEILRTHGLAGELKVAVLTDYPERFDSLERCIVWDEGRDARESRAVVATRRQGDAVLLSLDGCDSVEEARGLVGRLLAVPESEAVSLPPDRFYPWQLEGCRVVTEEGRELGAIAGVSGSSLQDIWIVRGDGREHLVPAVPEIVLEVDLGGRRVVIRPPEGLLDL